MIKLYLSTEFITVNFNGIDIIIVLFSFLCTGLVFLQFRSETKRALLPNEITSIDTVRALFVRSFPRQLTMAYLEGPASKIYIHDASKDMFYELEDVRSHLREIRDRSVLRLFESTEVAAPLALPGGPGIPQPLPQPVSNVWDQEQNYFSEPEFDTEYQHQHIHKNKVSLECVFFLGRIKSRLLFFCWVQVKKCIRRLLFRITIIYNKNS